uniref:Conotoxin Rg11a n=1 Tax=Conus regius TaxID=101314 RepID=I1BA_CONRE|nr:RecName: Full=Conotoxin Rg11a [Conus regius]
CQAYGESCSAVVRCCDPNAVCCQYPEDAVCVTRGYCRPPATVLT